MSTSWHFERASPTDPNLSCQRVDQSTLILNTCSAYIIDATHFGIAFLGHLSKCEIFLSMVKNLHFLSKSWIWLYSAPLTCNDVREKILATTDQSEGSLLTSLQRWLTTAAIHSPNPDKFLQRDCGKSPTCT